MANKTIDEMKRALLGGYDEQGEEQTGLFGYLSAPGQYLRGGLSDILSWLPGGVPAHGFTGRKMWGEDVLREHLGMENQPGLDMTDVLGTGMDLLVDPLNLLYGAGAIKGGLKAARMLPKLLSSAGRAESLAAAKAAMGAIPGAAKRHVPGLAFGLGVPMAGAQMMNPPGEEGPGWRDLMGMGMMTLPMALPLGMAAARKMKGTAKKPFFEKTKEEAGFYQDNPVVKWGDTESTRKWLESNPRTVTAEYSGIRIDPKLLLDIPGEMGEHTRIEKSKVSKLAQSMKEKGFTGEDRPLIMVEKDGAATMWEGNHRVRAAVEAGLDDIPIDVRYAGGSEMLPGVFDPHQLRVKEYHRKRLADSAARLNARIQADESAAEARAALQPEKPLEMP